MGMDIAIVLHVFFVVVWVGGMFFAHQCLRPVAAAQLEPPLRLRLWVGVFGRFFPWVWAAIVLVPASGLFMMLGPLGGFAHLPLYIHAMFGLGLVMVGVFLRVFFSPYPALRKAVAAGDWPAGAAQLARIRRLVGINTLLGTLTLAIGAGGRYFG